MHRSDGPAEGRPASRTCGGGCRPGRRAFLRQAAVAIAGTMAAIGISEGADAMTVGFGDPGRAEGDELTYPLPAADGATIDRTNQVIIVRYQGNVYAFNLSCPHQNAAVRWKPADGRFECTRHDSKYRLDGVYLEGRATRNMDRFAIRRAGDSVVVDVSKMYSSDLQAGEWKAAEIKLG